MNEAASFQRARKPEEQQLRREALLAAAAELFDAEGPQGTGLTAIAARAGFTKSNVYRYFESREDVLLSLFEGELRAFVGAFETAVSGCAVNDTDALALAVTELFEARPRFCALMSILNNVLEQNVSEEAIIALKRGVADLNFRLASALADRLPGTAIMDCAWVGAMTATLVQGLWPGANPSAAAARVLQLPEFSHLKPQLNRDLPRAIKALMRSIMP